jgi:hypothetical protein
MVSALSEASNLHNCVEETLFHDPSGNHIREEARAILRGWDSYISFGGVNLVSYAGQGNSTGRMLVDGDTIVTPYHAVWTPGEIHTLQCQDTLDWGWQYEFSHWSQELLGQGVDPWSCWINPHFDTVWTFVVPQGENSYYAYMKGGPYRDSVYSPNGGEVWAVGEVHPIRWFAFEGADSTTLIDIFLSTDGGSNWELVETGLPWGVYEPGYLWTGQYYWTISATPSTQCRIKVRAYDCAGNDTSDISNADFTINCAPKPEAPSNLTATNNGCDSRITLFWDDNSYNEEGFNIYRDGLLTGSVGVNETTFVQTYLVAGRSYSYQVKAFIGDCESEVSNMVNQTPGLMMPEAPTNLQVTNVGECQFLATWEDNSDNEDGFVLYNGPYWHASLGPDVTSFQGYWYPESEWAEPADFYIYAYSGHVVGGCKSYSEHVVIQPPGGVIAAPTDCQLHGPACYLTATWDNNDDYDLCQVKHIYTGCDAEPWDCLPDWYWYTFFSSCGQTPIPPPSGCGCVCAKVRGGQSVDCGSLGNMKWSAYSNQPCLERVICNDPNPGCPYLFLFDGERFMGENTILASVEMTQDGGIDVDDYYLLRESIPGYDDVYKLQIAEFEDEHSFLDQVELLAVDHDFYSEIAVTREGKIFVYDPGEFWEPLSCYDEKGANRDSLLRLDPEEYVYLSGPGELILDFGAVPSDSGAQILLLPCCGDPQQPKSNPRMAAGENPVPQIGLLVQAEEEGVWQVIDSIPPRMAMQSVCVDLTDILRSQSSLRVRLSWDERGYTVSRFRCFQAQEIDCPEPLKLIGASHSTSGDVTEKLEFDDWDYAELKPGENIELTFSYVPMEPGKTRNLVFKSNGYYLRESWEKAVVSTRTSQQLMQNYPNPFNPQTQIEFSLVEASKVTLTVYNLLGQKVVTLVDEILPAGRHVFNWDGQDESGREVASGLYFYNLQAGDHGDVGKMTLMK